MESLNVQTSHAEYRKTHKGFSNTRTAPKAKSKDKKDRSQRINREKDEIQIIKDAENRYEDLKIRGTAENPRSGEQPTSRNLQGLYIISKKEKETQKQHHGQENGSHIHQKMQKTG